jgi:hypothetical protein
MADELRKRYVDILEGSYDCVDRIVLNAYFRRGHSGGGFRAWVPSLSLRAFGPRNFMKMLSCSFSVSAYSLT